MIWRRRLLDRSGIQISMNLRCLCSHSDNVSAMPSSDFWRTHAGLTLSEPSLLFTEREPKLSVIPGVRTDTDRNADHPVVSMSNVNQSSHRRKRRGTLIYCTAVVPIMYKMKILKPVLAHQRISVYTINIGHRPTYSIKMSSKSPFRSLHLLGI